jgi:hypothetical protein
MKSQEIMGSHSLELEIYLKFIIIEQGRSS